MCIHRNNDGFDLGDFPVVEFFATQYPATKKQTNKSGATPLQVAQNLGFKRIAEFLLSGKILPDEPDKPIDDAKPKHSRAALIQAAKNGHVQTIENFVKNVMNQKKRRNKCANH